ncbi:MAG: hypothetical protein BWZ04_02939 [Firmicutes bacterium ADurb.BinA205]|nr:MAG: hypothetical protein BWZ04_02939 [Firmicutes bacterium ADurb.BinA205]
MTCLLGFKRNSQLLFYYRLIDIFQPIIKCVIFILKCLERGFVFSLFLFYFGFPYPFEFGYLIICIILYSLLLGFHSGIEFGFQFLFFFGSDFNRFLHFEFKTGYRFLPLG